MKYRPEYDLHVVGANLRRLREAKHLSVEYVREYLMLGSVQAVYKYERGISYPQADTLLALMHLYDAAPEEIVRGSVISYGYEEEGIEPSSCFISIFAAYSCFLNFSISFCSIWFVSSGEHT